MSANLANFKTVAGDSGNFLSIKTWIAYILGFLLLFGSWSIAQKAGKIVEGKVPGADFTPNQPWETPRVVSSGPREVVI